MTGPEVSTELDRAIWGPSFKVPMLDWWRGIYQHVFIAYHPFFKLPHIDAVVSQDEKRNYLEVFWEDTDPEEADNLIKRTGQAISWAEVHLNVAPEVHKEIFDRAAWLLSCIGFQERANIQLQKRIEAYCDEQKICFPQADGLPSIMEVPVGEFLSQIGAKSVTAWDEFRMESCELPLSMFDRINPPNKIDTLSVHTNLWALHLSDPGLLMTWDFDGTEVLIAMTDQALEQARPEDFFEGWYADQTTYCDVFNPHDFFERDV